jgi:CubicO group peptidase (beta-lactamase class C family)
LVPGLVTLVSYHDENNVDALGTTSIGRAGSQPVRRVTIFRIASMTKPITAVATMILVEESKLHLDEPVDRLLPELAKRKVLKRVDGPLDDTIPAKRPITVRDLLTFQLGLVFLLAPPDSHPIVKAMYEQQVGVTPFPAQMPHPPDEWMRRLGTLPLMYQPGRAATDGPHDLGENTGWGFGVSVLTKPDGLATRAGRYGWNGGLGSSWWNDPNERLTAIIVTERTFESADPPNVIKDFWKSAYEAVRTGS